MKHSLPILLLTLLHTTILGAFAEGGRSAKSAFETFTKLRGSSAGITEIFGARGMDQPVVWRITTQESNGQLMDHFLQNGKLMGSQPSQSRQNSKIPTAQWKWDSTHVFSKVEQAAKAARVGFDSADYSLRGAPSRTYWVVSLNNAEGKKIAELTVSAESGKVTNQNFTGPVQPAPQMANNATQPSAAVQAGQNLRTGLSNAGSSVKGFLSGLFGGGNSSQPQSGGYNQPAHTPGQTYYYRPGTPNWQQPAGAFGSGR